MLAHDVGLTTCDRTAIGLEQARQEVSRTAEHPRERHAAGRLRQWFHDAVLNLNSNQVRDDGIGQALEVELAGLHKAHQRVLHALERIGKESLGLGCSVGDGVDVVAQRLGNAHLPRALSIPPGFNRFDHDRRGFDGLIAQALLGICRQFGATLLGIPDLLLDREEVLALDVGNLLRLGVQANQLGLEDVLIVGLLQAVGEGIDALSLIKLLLGIKTIIHSLHQSGSRLDSLRTKTLLSLSGQLGSALFCIPYLLFNSQEVFAALGGQCLIAGILANQRVLKLVLFVGLL